MASLSSSSVINSSAGCAVRMADGRLFTDYRPRCDIAHQFSAPMAGSYEYRQWMMRNGQRIIDYQRSIAFTGARCAPCAAMSTMPQEKDRFVCDKVACARVPSQFDSTIAQVRSFATGRDYSG